MRALLLWRVARHPAGFTLCTAIVSLATALNVPASAQQIGANYTVAVADTAAHLFHVTATFSSLDQPELQVSLPIWTPGWYTLEYYGKNVLRFEARDASGARLRTLAIKSQTWSVDTRGKDRITVEFDYLANIKAANQAVVNGRHAFFTGTQLFLEPIGHRTAPATVRFVVPEGWSIVSALHETSEPTTYTAADYDELVDAPAWLGAVEIHRFDVVNKPHYIAVEPGHFAADSIAAFAGRVARVVEAAAAIFGGLPYEKYVFFYLPGPAQSPATGLEHGNSVVMIDKPLRALPAGEAHEFFHVWNVKRIRPARMWPYDYSRPNETPSLWVSEGITRYYSDLIMYRAGFWADSTFLEQLAEVIGYVEANPAARYVSPSDASMTTWQDYELGRPFGVSYYLQGQVLGALLDVSILHDTHGRRGLDDVMRALYRDFYSRGKGFTPEDFVRTVNAVSGHDYGDFFHRYVTGVETPDADGLLGYAGARMVRRQRILGFLGATHSAVADGVRLDEVNVGGPAYVAGLRVGDVITAADGVPAKQVRMPYNCCITVNKGTDRVVFTVLRDGNQFSATVLLQIGPTADSIELDPNPTAEQSLIRRGWLGR